MSHRAEFSGIRDLPELLRFSDGSPVTSDADWERRRLELTAVLEGLCYGRMPPRPSCSPVVRMIQPPVALRGSEQRSLVSIYETYPFADSDYRLEFQLYMPGAADAPPPVMICGDGCWRRITAETADIAHSHGFALVEFNRCALVSDPPFRDVSGGPREASPRDSVLQRRFKELDFGAIAGWAWGFSRIYDALEVTGAVDCAHAAVCGHSRGGKASLLAGALDSRFAAVCSSGSGSGGAGSWLLRAKGAEPLDFMLDAFPSWFSESFQKFRGQSDELPFDSHFLKALCAPRPMLTTDGYADLWANPAGSCATTIKAREVYRFLRAPDDAAGWRLRDGGHGHEPEDWAAMFEFCRHHFSGSALSWDPTEVLYEDLPAGC